MFKLWWHYEEKKCFTIDLATQFLSYIVDVINCLPFIKI